MPTKVKRKAAMRKFLQRKVKEYQHLAVSILKQRLTGYDIQMAWDHRRTDSVVSFNSTMTEDAFYPVSLEEFEPIQLAFSESASVRERSQSQVHRYLLTAVLYGLPFNFFVEQPSRLAAIKLEDVNRMMEFSFEQIKTR
jgi:predicted Zn-dependent peptidase